MGELGDGADRLLRLARDAERVEHESLLLGHPEGTGHDAKDERVGILEENHPLLARGAPPVEEPAGVEQRVDVAVAVGLGLEGVRVGIFEREVRVVVGQARHLLLLNEGHLLLLSAEVVVALEEVEGLGVGVVGGHDGEGDADVLGAAVRGHLARGPLLQREDGLNVELEVARVRGPLARELDLDAGVPEALAETSRDEDERGGSDLPHALALELDVLLGRVLDHDAVGHRGGPPVEGVDAFLGILEELLGVGDVLRDATGVARVADGGLREEPALVVVVGAGRGPRREEVVLPAAEELVDHGVLIGGEDTAVGLEGRARLAFLGLLSMTNGGEGQMIGTGNTQTERCRSGKRVIPGDIAGRGVRTGVSSLMSRGLKQEAKPITRARRTG